MKNFMGSDLLSAICRSLKELKKNNNNKDLHQVINLTLVYCNLPNNWYNQGLYTVFSSAQLCKTFLLKNHEYSLLINSTHQYSKSILKQCF